MASRSYLTSLAFFLAVLIAASASEIDEWAPWGSWVPNSTSGSIPFGDGSISVSVSPSGLKTSGSSSPTAFVTKSVRYENIDSLTYDSLKIQPKAEQTGQPWSVEFDLVDTTLNHNGTFNVGQIFISGMGTPLTQLKLTFYAADDVTVFRRSLLDFEQHARNASDFGAALDWDARSGVLSVAPEGAGQNSMYAFFRPRRGEVGRILVDATTMQSQNGDTIDFAFGTLSGEDLGEAYWLEFLILVLLLLLIISLVLWLAGRLVVGENATLRAAVLVALTGSIIGAVVAALIPLIGWLVALLVWLLLISRFFRTGWIRAIVVAILAFLIAVGLEILLRLLLGVSLTTSII